MSKSYGEQVREARQKAGLSLKEVSEKLSVSIPYLSDVERGRRNPLGVEQNAILAELLDIDSVQLLTLAGIERGHFRIPTDNADVVKGLLLALPRMSKADIAAVMKIVDGANGGAESIAEKARKWDEEGVF